MSENWKNAKELISYSKGGITRKTIFKTKAMDEALFCMWKGTELSEHTSAREGLVIVLEGKGIFTLKGKKILMRPETIIHMEKNARHSLEAEENTAFLLVLFK